MSDIRHIVIVGAGECGVRAALTLRDAGFDGDITLVHGEAGVPYERPPLSKPAHEDVIRRPIMGIERFSSEHISVLDDHRAINIDLRARLVTLAGGKILSYDRLLLATGAQPRMLMIDGHICTNAHVFRNFSDAKRIFDELSSDKRLTIIGGGFIGLELAAAARQRQVSTTVIEVASRLLARAVPAPLAARIEARHRDHQVHFHIGHAITSISPTHNVSLSDGSIIESDILVAGIGSLPDTSLAQSCGLSLANGIAVNEYFQTSDPHIFAAGDCCSFPHPLYGMKRMRLESWRAAQDQGTHAAHAMLGSKSPYQAVPWFWSDHYDLTLQIAGVPSEGEEIVIRQIDEESEILFHRDFAGRLVGASGLGPGNRVARDIRLAEMIIAKGLTPHAEALMNPTVSLKSLLASQA